MSLRKVSQKRKTRILWKVMRVIKKGDKKRKIDDIEKSEGVNLLTHKTNFVLVDNSLCLQESWKQLKENDEERRRLMKFKENPKNAKREQSLCYKKGRMSFSSTLTVINISFSFKKLKLFVISNIFLKLDLKFLISLLVLGFKFFHFHYKEIP
ncbi:hypothetical protein M9H77_35442 [Catharanthus roseus]|uniref:Uncharacterized protein n=1 Tax=Catharanthus roseus TaxID=4058 RepID=A0ACB9ZR73_CATRO|nr:hypothetical protein M9H77_35442 [Catharanthus roseus]